MPTAAKRVKIRVQTKQPPVAEISGEGTATYVWFNRSAKYDRTIEVSTWPVVNIDVDKNGVVIGIEAIGIKEFTVRKIMEQAGLKAPASLLSRARYVHADTAAAV